MVSGVMQMADLIERSALNEAIEEFFDGVCVYDVTPFEAVYDFQSIVDAMPAVDAVPVVRCKNCKMFYMKKDIFGKVSWCKAWHRETIETMFCGWGKRKEELRDG